MITESTIYWLTRLDHIHSLLEAFNFVLILAVCFCFMGLIPCIVEEEPQIFSKLKNWGFIFLTVLFFSAVVGAMLPTTKEYAAIKVIPAIANNQDVKDIGNDIVDLAKDWLKQMKPKALPEKVKE